MGYEPTRERRGIALTWGCGKQTVITDPLDGQYNNPVRVVGVGFNTSDGWARDVSEEIADEIRRCCDLLMRDPLERHERRDSRQLTLRLV